MNIAFAEYLKKNETIKNADGVILTGKSSHTVKRYLLKLVQLDVLIPEGDNKGRIYRRKSAD